MGSDTQNTQDPAAVLRTLLEAAEQGDVRSQVEVATAYLKGRGVSPDHLEAIEWYRKAADQGNADAQNNLAAMYYEGRGVTQDYAEALEWFCKAADQGNSNAQRNLALMYYRGEGVTQDYVQAYMWLKLFAAGSEAKEKEEVAKFCDAIAIRMTPQKIAEAQRLAREWKPKQVN